MQKDDRGYFRTRVELEDGIYQYKFRVQSKSWFLKPDEWVEVNDPYVTEIEPETGNGIVRIDKGKRIVDTYIWQHDDKFLPSDRELVIYELYIGDFSDAEGNPQKPGRFRDLVEKLDYLCELGINAIELMPVSECGFQYSWGYLTRNFFAPQPSYGSTTDLKRLIDECHARGIRVILDQLFNHSSEECPLHQIDRDCWYYHDRHHPEDPFYWGPEFNYEKFDDNLGIRPAWQYMGDVVRFWIEEYHIDGIRFDALKQLDNWDFLRWIVGECKRAAGVKPLYTVGEHVPEKTNLVTPEGPMDACWHDSFFHLVNPHLCCEMFDIEQLKTVIDHKRQGYPAGVTKVVNYITNHDQNRLFADLGDRGIFNDEAFKRAKLGAALLVTASGIPMIWMGQEFAECKHREPNFPKKLDWDLLKNERNQNLLEYYKKLIAIRKQTPALQTDCIEFFHTDPESRILGDVRWDEGGSQVIVVANFSGKCFEKYRVPYFPTTQRTWYDWSDNRQVETPENQLTIEWQGWEAKIFLSHQPEKVPQGSGDCEMTSVGRSLRSP